MKPTHDPARRLIALFEHPFREERHRALHELVALGEEAVSPLLEAVQSQEPRTRAGALRALARLGSPRALDTMMRFVQDNALRPGDDRAFAMQAVAAATHPDVPQARELFYFLQQTSRDADVFVRGFAYEALGALGDPRASGLLERGARDKEPFVVEKATAALARLASRAAPPPQEDRLMDLEQIGFALQANDLERRQLGIGEVLRRQRAGQDLLGLVLQVLAGPNRLGRLSALEVLARLADARALGAVTQALYSEHSDADTKARALRVVAAVGRRAALEVLGEAGIERLGRALLEALRGGDLFVRAAAVSALGVLPEDEALPRLVEAAHDENAWVREEASAALLRHAGGALAPWLGALARLGEHSLQELERAPGAAGDDGSGTAQDLRRFQERLLRLVMDTVALSPALRPEAEAAALSLGIAALGASRAALRVEGLRLLGHLSRAGMRPALSAAQVRAIATALGSARRDLVEQALGLLRAWLPRRAEAATARLLALLREADEALALEIIPLLGRAADPEALAALRALERHPSARQRAAAQDALAEASAG
jgi:HEAT repeat protein